MFHLHTIRLLLLLMAAACAVLATAPARAGILNEPNNNANQPTILPNGLFVIQDDLSAEPAFFDTVIRQYTGDNQTGLGPLGTPLADHAGSQLLNVPLSGTGTSHFRISGLEDVNFSGAHAQSGQYFVQFDLFNAQQAFVKTVFWENQQIENVVPGQFDFVWIDPTPIGIPNGFANVTVHHLPKPAAGDAVDFMLVTGLPPNTPFTGAITNADFFALVRQFDSQKKPIAGTSDTSIAGVSDGFGRALLGVTGQGDVTFKGLHEEVGAYTLLVVPVPEPMSLALAAIGGTALLLVARRPANRR